jgi:flagellar protein FlaG
MLIQNFSSSPVPAPAASNGSSGSPVVAIQVPDTGSALVGPGHTAVPPANHAAQPTPSQLQSAIDKLNQAMTQSNTGLEFSIDSESKKTLIKVVDTATGATIRQFPSKEMIAISAAIDQFQKGLLFKQKA